MPPFIRFVLFRLLSIPVTLFFVTAALYGIIMLAPPEERASLYFPSNFNPDVLTPDQLKAFTDRYIKRYHLDAPFPIQYGLWVYNLLQGKWGYSPTIHDQVLDALLRRTPVTGELALYSLLVFIPVGLVSGVVAGWKQDTRFDNRFRFTAFVATSLPPFILAIVFLAIFYVMVNWFPPERLSIRNSQLVYSEDFRTFTGLLTIDGLLNRRPDISLDALRHLVLPVITLCLFHWATLARITRSSMIEELQKDYVMAARARGVPTKMLVWKHAFRNAISPALATSALSAASLFTGVFVVEVIYNFNGVSELAVRALRDIPDAPIALGFTLYSVIIVLLLMLILDLIRAVLDPRVREGFLI